MKNFFEHEGRLCRNSDCTVVRQEYMRHFRDINTTSQLKATLRAGAFTDVGGYPLYLLTSDGAALCFTCARKELHQVVWSIRNDVSDGWRVVGCDTNTEDEDLVCDHCNENIPSAYGS